MKKFIWHSLVLSILFFPMNVLSRIDYVHVWNDGEPKYVTRINEKDTLGQRMKEYEKNWNSTVLDLTKPIYARIDGRHFSPFTGILVIRIR